MQVGPGDGFRLRIGGFNVYLSTLGNSFTDFEDETSSDLNEMNFSTRYDVKH